MQKQLTLIKKMPNQMGGVYLKGNPRHKRPFHSKKPLHLVLKSSLCKGNFSLLQKKYVNRVKATIYFYAKIYGIKIYRFQNVGNHIHLVIQCSRRDFYSNFIRSITGRIAQVLLKDMGFDSSGGDPTKKNGEQKPNFWDYRPFTRIIEWGKGFSTIKNYMLKNTLNVLNLPRTSKNLSNLKMFMKVTKTKPPPLVQQSLLILA